jgi:hypothetical protein
MHPKKIDKVKLFSGIMFSDEERLERTISILKRLFGDVDLVSEICPFDFTEYYEEEMGKNLKKIFISFKKLINREKLAEIKLKTIKVEDESAESKNRTVNIDPGYLTLHNVILASAKEMPHRIYIGKGIFGDAVLEYKRDKGFADSCHTFPDFKSQNVKEIMKKIRTIYKKQIC